ncbi:MAG: MarR family winged helix-turn-helix transcriptional regulator, partial [Nitrososphaeraceae archaeon]
KRKKPHLQIGILKSIASSGLASQKEIASQFGYKPSTISDAFKIMDNAKLIRWANVPEFKKGVRRERFYKLSAKGLSVVLDENPSPQEFWMAMIWYYRLNTKAVGKDEFNRYYDRFIQKSVGSFSLHSYFFLGDIFDSLFKKKWSRKLFGYQYDDQSRAHGYNYYNNNNNNNNNNDNKLPKTTQNYKVLECLLLNRQITIQNIASLTQLSEKEIRKILNEYIITQSSNSYSNYANLFEGAYQSDKSIDVTLDFLNHLVVIPIKKDEGQEKIQKAGEDSGSTTEKYELSLLGVLLMLATKSLMRKRQEKIFQDSDRGYYNKIASTYPDKLPLIFGKWKLLKDALNFDFFLSLFDYLFLDKSEISSLSVLLGGNKEIYDNIRSDTLGKINKFLKVYDDGISAVQSDDFSKAYLQKGGEHYQFIQEKLNGIEILLRYTSLKSFAKYMINKKGKSEPDFSSHVSLKDKDMPVWKVNEQLVDNRVDEKNINFEDDLRFIEKALADEFSFLVFIGLLRDNNHKASDYPLTTAFITPSQSLVYPKDFLMQIVRSDMEIRKKLREWIDEATSYQKLTLARMNEIHLE